MVATPNPRDDTRMDISDRFRPFEQYGFPASASVSSRGDSSGPGSYRGSLNVTGMTRSVGDQFGGAPRPLSGAMSLVGLSGAMGIGSALSLKNLQRIEDNQQAGKVGNAVGMLNGRIIGVSPAPFGGGYVLSGVLPPNLTHDQRKQIINQLLDMNPTTQLVGGKLPTKDDPDPPPPTATPDVVDKINQGIDPEAAGFEAGLGTQAGYNIATDTSFDFEDRKGGVPAPASIPPNIADPYADVPPGFGAMTAEDFDFGYDAPAASEPSAVSLTTTTDASPPPSPPPSRPPDFVTYTPPQDDSDDGNNNTGTQYSFSDLVPDEDDDFIDDTPIPSDESDSTETGGGGGGCCFIMLEARYGDGTMDDVVRRYRDEHMTVRNKRGYYKVAEVLVPLMRKSRLAKWLVIKTFADPLVSYGKYYYGQNKHGVIFAPVKSFWMSVFNIVGGETEFIRENGKVV
jgi:hypothetical protein